MLAQPAARVQAMEQVQFLGAEGGRAMSGTKSPKTLKAMELLKDQRLTNKQIAIRSGVSVRHVRRLRNQMEVEQCK